jgi:glycosyltransferase involved in cell wall biosynthesis
VPLTVYGDGPDRKRLEAMAGPSVKFTGFVSNEKVVQLLSNAQAYIFPLLDDFGIASIESLAAGTPVIAYKAGGALDYIIPGKTGAFFEPQTPEALEKALKNFDPKKYKPSAIKEFAKKFSTENFQKQMTEFLNRIIE